MPQIGNYFVSSTNSNGKTDSAIRVYLDGVRLVNFVFQQRNPLGYIRKHPSGNWAKQFQASCRVAGLNDDDIRSILK